MQKNIIFGDCYKYKPEIAFDDALNNDICIIKNENQCLIYSRPIPSTGVMWSDLVNWYIQEYTVTSDKLEQVFVRRLCDCLDVSFKSNGATSGPETWMLQAYYTLMKELKMDFLMVFSHKNRVVIEIDGKQHYAVENVASPKLYSEMVRAHREMALYGYDVYRFGGYEFVGADTNKEIKERVIEDLKDFFRRLFYKYGILKEA